jgi:hypothetical protein
MILHARALGSSRAVARAFEDVVHVLREVERGGETTLSRAIVLFGVGIFLVQQRSHIQDVRSA